MTPTESFLRARNRLLDLREDYESAYRTFQWPPLEHFNWAIDWFDVFARGNRREALRVVRGTSMQRDARTFEELSERSSRMAQALRGLGVRKGDRILLRLGHRPELWETMLAAMKVGAVVVPASPQLTREDLEDRMLRGRIGYVVSEGDHAEQLHGLPNAPTLIGVGDSPQGWVPYDRLLNGAAGFVPEGPTSARDPLLLYFTSGTTAKPKLVLHTHTSYPVGHLSTMYWVGLQEADVHQNISAPGWAKHAWSSFFAPWIAGATVVVHDAARFDARRFLDLLRTEGITTLCAPPTVWRMVVSQEMGPRPPALRELVGAGEPLNPEVVARVKSAWGLGLRDGYGQTETTALVGNTPGQPLRPGSMGRPLPGYTVDLVGDQGEPTDDGELALRLSHGPLGLMAGYGDAPEKMEAIRESGLYRTGDRAFRDRDGYLTFVGRGDDVFKSSDYRISPFELESVLIEHPDVAEAAVVPSPDALRLAVPKGFVALRPGVEPSDALAREILAFARERLAPYKRIRKLEFADLPKTASGKIRRHELRRREEEAQGGGGVSEVEGALPLKGAARA